MRLIASHDGRTGDLNDNEEFLNKISKLENESDTVTCVEEYFVNIVVVYKKGNRYVVYYTHEQGNGNVDGYILEGTNIENIFETVLKTRGSKNKIQKWLDQLK